MTCSAVHHNTWWAYRRYGCRCPEIVERVRARNRRRQQPGRNLAGPRNRDQGVDEIAVERACGGERVPLTLLERAVAIQRLTAAGLAAREIGRRLGLSSRTVHRYRSGVVKHGRLDRAEAA